MLILWVSLGSVLLIYCISILSVAWSWVRIKPFKPGKYNFKPNTFISVIIALRNEESNIPSLINSLKSQTYGKDNFEVILVNDHSADNTFNLAKQYAETNTWVRLIDLDEHLQGKKNAISKGVLAAKGQLLAFTDGDCKVPQSWLITLANFFEERNRPDLIIGLVDLETNSFLQKFFRLEFLSLILSGAGAAGISKPIYCNAANMAVKSSVMKDINTKHEISSGDDVFLLHEMKAKGKCIELLKSPSHLVTTKSPETFTEFYEQRKRWAAKAKNYNDKTALFTALLVLVSNIAFAAGITIMFCSQQYEPGITLSALKFTTDFILFLTGVRYFHYAKLLPLIPIMSIFYPIYIIITAFSSQKSPFIWKGRKYLR